MIPLIDDTICTGCSQCLDVCPPRAIILIDKKARIETEFCEECGLCSAECPIEAITIPFPQSDI
jgi:uncharacterized protein